VLWILLVACVGDVQQAPGSASSLFDGPTLDLPPGEPPPMPRDAAVTPIREESAGCRRARRRFAQVERQVVSFRNGTMQPVSDAVDRAQEALDWCLMDTSRCGLDTVRNKESLGVALARYDAALARLAREEVRLHPLQSEVRAACD
jgi:hypothetical protein